MENEEMDDNKIKVPSIEYDLSDDVLLTMYSLAGRTVWCVTYKKLEQRCIVDPLSAKAILDNQEMVNPYVSFAELDKNDGVVRFCADEVCDDCTRGDDEETCVAKEMQGDGFVRQALQTLMERRDSIEQRATNVSRAMGETGVNLLEGILTLVISMIPAAAASNLGPSDLAKLVKIISQHTTLIAHNQVQVNPNAN
jgi:hypothetical protein